MTTIVPRSSRRPPRCSSTSPTAPFSRRGSFLHVERGFRGDDPRVLLNSARRDVWRKVSGGWGTHFFTVGTDRDENYDTVGHPAERVATPG